jgi:two-component system phosphate regulon sensor histidine kinase PhoR
MILARPGRKQLVLPTIPLVALGALLTITLVRGGELQGTVLPWSMLLVSVAMAFRTAAAARESRHLLGLERDQLLASLSHEIRTPLTAVAGFSHVLSTSWDVVEDVERQELIELIGSEAESLVDIIGDMNALVRSELDAASLELERIQGKHLIAEAIKLVFRLDGQLPVRAEVEPYLELVCDRRRMVQVLRALFENAVRYGDGKILVVAKRTKTGRVIEVHDNGSGVERRHENTIWKRFERGEHELNANVPGSGLGLAVVRSIARAHQGDARYRRSERLGGACFSIELPYDSDVEHRRPGR